MTNGPDRHRIADHIWGFADAASMRCSHLPCRPKADVLGSLNELPTTRHINVTLAPVTPTDGTIRHPDLDLFDRAKLTRIIRTAFIRPLLAEWETADFEIAGSSLSRGSCRRSGRARARTLRVVTR